MSWRVSLKDQDGVIHDITARVSREDLGSLSLSVERNLHEFRSGDLTLLADNSDGFFDDVFAGLENTDRPRIEVERDEELRFAGVILPGEMIRFDQKDETVEITALGLVKLLEDLSAESVSRPTTAYSLNGSHSSGVSTLALDSTAGLQLGDELGASFGEVYEIVAINGSDVDVSPALQSTYPDGFRMKLLTPFLRYKTPAYLLDALLDLAEAAGIITGRSVQLDGDVQSAPIISESNLNGQDIAAALQSMTQKAGKLTLSGTAAVDNNFSQDSPDQDWVDLGTAITYVDWTPYRTQAEGEPTTFLESPVSLPFQSGWDFQPAPGTSTQYLMVVDNASGPKTVKIRKRTTTDGSTWTGLSDVVTLASGSANGYHTTTAIDYDPVRNFIFWSWMEQSPGTLRQFGYYDIGAATNHVVDSTIFLRGIRYSKEADRIIGNAQPTAGLPYADSDRVLQYRGAVKLFDVEAGFDIDDAPQFRHSRYSGGVWYVFGGNRTGGYLYLSRDDWQTLQAFKLTDGSTGLITVAGGLVRVWNPDEIPRIFVVAPAFLGIIPYADFEGMTVADGLRELAVLLQAIFYIDELGVAHFRLRRRATPDTPDPIDDLVLKREHVEPWRETYDYVEVSPSGGGSAAGQGVKTARSRNLSVSSAFASSPGVASSLAASLLEFYSKRRGTDKVLLDDDGKVRRQFDRVQLDGKDWLLYELELTLQEYELEATLLEDVA